MVTIEANGSKWAGESPDSIDELLGVLARTPLNPMFEEYGNFILRDEKPLPDGVVRFWGNFHELSHVFSVDTDERDMIERLTSAIRANQATPAYIAARVERVEHEAARRAAQLAADEKRRAERLANARQLLRQAGG